MGAIVLSRTSYEYPQLSQESERAGERFTLSFYSCHAPLGGHELIGVSHAASEHLVMETQMPEWLTARFKIEVVPLAPSTWWR